MSPLRIKIIGIFTGMLSTLFSISPINAAHHVPVLENIKEIKQTRARASGALVRGLLFDQDSTLSRDALYLYVTHEQPSRYLCVEIKSADGLYEALHRAHLNGFERGLYRLDFPHSIYEEELKELSFDRLVMLPYFSNLSCKKKSNKLPLAYAVWGENDLNNVSTESIRFAVNASGNSARVRWKRNDGKIDALQCDRLGNEHPRFEFDTFCTVKKPTEPNMTLDYKIEILNFGKVIMDDWVSFTWKD